MLAELNANQMGKNGLGFVVETWVVDDSKGKRLSVAYKSLGFGSLSGLDRTSAYKQAELLRRSLNNSEWSTDDNSYNVIIRPFSLKDIRLSDFLRTL